MMQGNILHTVEERIKWARLRRNLSVAQITERATCSPLTVSRIEKGSLLYLSGSTYEYSMLCNSKTTSFSSLKVMNEGVAFETSLSSIDAVSPRKNKLCGNYLYMQIYADFDWLKELMLVGYELRVFAVTGSYGFQFDEEWLRTQDSLFLSADLNNYWGVQYATAGSDIFGYFSDVLLNRWGRTLLNRREQILTQEEKRPLCRLTYFDYLLGIDDYSRMGGFRFKESVDTEFINSTSLRIPPLTDIRELEAASKEIEQSEERNELTDGSWIAQLIQAGTSLGGARPKAIW